MIRRAPRAELSPFVSRLWASDAADERTEQSLGRHAGGAVGPDQRREGRSESEDAPSARELVLPTGAMHVVIRLDEPLRLFDGVDDDAPRTIGHAIVGGARAAPYIRDARPVRSVGAQLRPGVAALLLGVPADELAGRHTRLDDLWGSAADELREQLALAGDSQQRLDRFEAALLARLPRVRALHPAVAHALAQFATIDDIAAVVDEVGYSHRRFIELFRRDVGLAPKLYCRVERLQRALARLPRSSLAAVALGAGFSDQAHLSREFRELAGLSPGAYRTRTPGPSHHVALRERR